jgi:hypothetical protein
MSPDNFSEDEKRIADAIIAAEDIRDPLEGLAEKTAANPGAPFMPDALEALAALKTENRATFEAVRAQLKKAGCRVTALDDAIGKDDVRRAETCGLRRSARRSPDRQSRAGRYGRFRG